MLLQVLSLSAKCLFFKDFNVKELEFNGDYETWANDMGEYFTISGFSRYFKALQNYKLPELGDVDEKFAEELAVLHDQVKAQGRYVIHRSLGPTVKREISKERLLRVQFWTCG